MPNDSGVSFLDRRVAKLGEERGHYLWNLENDLYQARFLWQNYKALFGENRERVDLVNSISGSSAYWIERSMFENLMIMLCRLTDPEKQKRRSNISVSGLLGRLTSPPDTTLGDLVEQASISTNFARDWRNKKLAHCDLETRRGVHTLQPASRLAILEGFNAIAKCVQRYAFIEMDTHLVTWPIRKYENDAVEFLTALYLGKTEMLKRDEIRQQAIKEGRWEDVSSLDSLPDWLTFRPENEIDV